MLPVNAEHRKTTRVTRSLRSVLSMLASAVGAAGSPLVDSVPGGFQQCLTDACGYTERQASPSLQSAEAVIVWNRGNLGG